VATLPGFEMLEDGATRVFVLVSKAVQVEERKSPSRLVYVLKGAHVAKRNNRNPLVTVHMNTPVTSARLVPSGNDTHFVIDLRADAPPTWRVAEAQGGASLQVDFPKGTYVTGHAPDVLAAKRNETVDGTSSDEEEPAARDEGVPGPTRAVRAPARRATKKSGLPPSGAAPR